MLPFAIITITLALIFYSIGVWGEKLRGLLMRWHVSVFWLGFAFDTIGTSLMSRLGDNAFQLNFHGITGLAAIILMLFHALWATVVLIKKNESARQNFHKFSIIVWLIWLVPYISGAFLGMAT